MPKFQMILNTSAILFRQPVWDFDAVTKFSLRRSDSALNRILLIANMPWRFAAIFR